MVPNITGTVHRNPLLFSHSENIDHLINILDLADTIPLESESTPIELVPGNDYYLDVVHPQRIEVYNGSYCLSSNLDGY